MFGFEKLINPAGEGDPDVASEWAARGNRRRLRVFVIVFLAALIAGLAFTFSRPAEYRAQARIAVKAAGVVAGLPSSAPRAATVTTVTTAANDGGNRLQSETGILTSRPLIEAALAALRERGTEMPEFGVEPVQGIQAALAAELVEGTNLVNLTVIGTEPAHLAAILNALIDAYARRAAASYADSASVETDALRQELENVNQRLAEKRKALDDFRQKADIVSGERDENQILARVKGLSVSLNLANEKVAQAEGRVRSIRESLAAGKAMVRSRDNPTLAAMEARASQLRESLREMERTYTPQFMDMDPNIRGMRSRLADLEAQIVEQKASSGQVLLAEAEDELATARQAQQKLQSQIAEDRRAVHAFSGTFRTFKAMEEELAQLETSRSSLSERLLRTETSERSRMPSIQVIEPAAVPREIWRPDYARDTGIAVAASLALGLLAMAVVELFNRPPLPSTAPVILPQSWISVGQNLPPQLAGAAASLLPAAASPALLRGGAEMARELAQDEVAALLWTMPEKDVAWAVLLLSGATVDEIRHISAADLDAGSASIRLRGACARDLCVPRALLRQLDAGGLPEIPDADDELKRRLLCAAHDAGLDDPAAITPQMLRHTCIAHLVRQGLRFSDLELVVGSLSADALAGYAGLAPAGERRTLGEITRLMPALTEMEAGQGEAG